MHFGNVIVPGPRTHEESLAVDTDPEQLWTPAAARTTRRPRSTCGRVAADQRDTAFAPRRRVGRDRLRPTARGSKKLGRGLNVLREHRWDDKTYERHVKLNLRWVEESLEEFRAAQEKSSQGLGALWQ